MRPETIKFTADMPFRASVLEVSKYPSHWHNALEILYVLRGRDFLTVNGDACLLKEGDIAAVNSGEIHSIHKGKSEILVLQMDSDYCESVIPDFRYLFLRCCSTSDREQFPEKYNELIKQVLNISCLMAENPGKYQPIIIESFAEEMLIHLTDAFNYLRLGLGGKPMGDLQAKRFKNIYKAFLQNSCGQYRLSEMAAAQGVSRQHLSRDFSDKLGISFQGLLYKLRCVNAAKLLLTTDKRVHDIADSCGFSDVKYLIKHFKLNFGHAPSDFRRLYGADRKTLISQTRCRELPLSVLMTENNF